jgi:hypothetical protein
MPICSRYAQALVELACAAENALETKPRTLKRSERELWVDAATPLPIDSTSSIVSEFWEAREGWICSNGHWDVMLGTVHIEESDWKTPSVSSVHRLMDGGEGPPMVREGCTVTRGTDWDQENNDDGKDLYDLAKAKREKEKKQFEAQKAKGTEQDISPEPGEKITAEPSEAPEEDNDDHAKSASTDHQIESAKTKQKKFPGPKLAVGIVVAIENWGDSKGKALRVKWNLTGKEGTYRFGGDGGKFDVCHVEINSKGTKVKKRHPLPESAEQCASRHGFGKARTFSIILRIRKTSVKSSSSPAVLEGVLEWPDFSAGILVGVSTGDNGVLVLEEKKLLYGSRDSGWEARFGQPSFVPGTRFALATSNASEVSGRSTFKVSHIQNPLDGGQLYVHSEMKFPRPWSARSTPNYELPHPLTFDMSFKAPSLSVSKDGRTVTCSSADGRATAFASVGFSKGLHYWEVKVEQTNDIGCVFIGVAEKPSGTGSGSSFRHDATPKLNKWHGYGFVNFRATYAAGAERVYGKFKA